ncbi:hypothetical protein RJ640_025193 [Escallonia rubra]|nr:hypothetical protein RJ640_025193 [Escallonia rubra]
MASHSHYCCYSFCCCFSVLFFLFGISSVSAQLSSTYYASTCPKALYTIKTAVLNAVVKEHRMGASLLRLHFHDCFVNGCDASLLLDDTSSFTGEKTAGPNANSVRGFDVIDTIKSKLESICPGVFSCADILAVAARDSVVALGGPTWAVQLGRRDSTTASLSSANSDLPSFDLDLPDLTSVFTSKGLTVAEMVALSGAHTIGQARCVTFRDRIYNETSISSTFATSLKSNCPSSDGDDNLSPLDASTPVVFDNAYYKNLLNSKGLLHSDQQLFSGGSTNSQVTTYSTSAAAFYTDFASAMVKMGNLSPLTGTRLQFHSMRSTCSIMGKPCEGLYISADYTLHIHQKMASSSNSFSLMAMLLVFVLLMGSSSAQLSTNFYSKTCPKVLGTVKSGVQSAVSKEKRMGASLLRLHFHDCFVNGCDGSILLDDTSSFTGEKTAGPNNNSVRGFNVIDNIKSNVEKECPGVVSCADIVAIAARDSAVYLGGPTWDVKLGRRDSKTASLSAANSGVIPPPTSTLSNLINRFQAKGLSTKDMVALSGSHTIGQARCVLFRTRVHNQTDIDASFAKTRQGSCPLTPGSGDNNLAPLDLQTPTAFDNNYYKNVISQKGLLHTDQQLHSGGSTDSLVESYSKDSKTFNSDFAAAMVKMGDISPLTGSSGEIRKNCRKVNS